MDAQDLAHRGKLRSHKMKFHEHQKLGSRIILHPRSKKQVNNCSTNCSKSKQRMHLYYKDIKDASEFVRPPLAMKSKLTIPLPTNHMVDTVKRVPL